MNLVIVDELEIVRIGLRHLLGQQKNIEIVAEASKTEETISKCRTLEPDLVIIGLAIDRSLETELVQTLQQTVPKTKVIRYTWAKAVNIYSIIHNFRIGINGYVLKESPTSELLHAIHNVISGSSYIDSYLDNRSIEMLVETEKPKTIYKDNDLTPKETIILKLIAEGLTCSQIANKLQISARTVEQHRGHINKKLGLTHPKVEQARYARAFKMIEASEQ